MQSIDQRVRQWTGNPSPGQAAIAIGMSYAGDSQVERVAAGSRSFTNSALGLSLAADGSGTTAYIRDNQGKLTEQRTPGGNYYYCSRRLRQWQLGGSRLWNQEKIPSSRSGG